MKDDKISIVKGIAIILMVVGHSGCPPLLDKTIYLFHMPLFFFVAGWFFKAKYLSDKKAFFIKRARGLYWPFVKYGFIFLCLHNVFCTLNFYDLSFYVDGSRSYVGFYNVQQFIDKAISIITFRGSDQLLGGFWFLKVLFFASLISLWGLYIANVLTKMLLKKDDICQYVLATALLIVTLGIAALGKDTRYTMASLLFVLGYIAGKYKHKISMNPLLLIPLLLILVVAAKFIPMSMLGVNSTLTVIYYLTVSLLGIYFALVAANLLVKSIFKKVLIYIGNNTLGVLVFHMISFKLVSLFKIYHYDLPITALQKFPVIPADNSFYWILYSIVGVAIPIGLDYMFKIKGGLYSQIISNRLR